MVLSVFLLFLHVKFWHLMLYAFSLGHVWKIQCPAAVIWLYGLNIYVAVNEKKRITAFISFAFIYFSYTTGKLCQENKTWFPCVCLWRPGCERQRHKSCHFIFPLNLEHGSLPCRIQDWSLTFSLVPSLAWSHFLSIWFLAPYATFLFPACRQQGVALLSPS